MAVDRNAITLQTDALDLDLLLPDINFDIDFEERLAAPRGGRHVVRPADVTLATADDQFLADTGYDLDLGPSDGIGSQDFELGLDFGERSSERGYDDADESVELPRDAAQPRRARDSLASHMLGRDDMDADFDLMSRRSRAPSEHPFDADMDLDLGAGAGLDLGDLGISFDGGADVPMMSDREKTPEQTRSPSEQLKQPKTLNHTDRS
jgi:cohesin complex subunit SCC1